MRFRYAGRDGGERERTVEPVRMVATGRRWYLRPGGVDRDDWRTFRLDRMCEVVATTWRFRAREHPGSGRLRAAVGNRGAVPVSRPGAGAGPPRPAAGAGAASGGARGGGSRRMVRARRRRGGSGPARHARGPAGFEAEVLEPGSRRPKTASASAQVLSAGETWCCGKASHTSAPPSVRLVAP
ncbi:helix-turn-helix transcriptional regulator [Nonomuraea sp. NPDC049400]|uniref:helix-turn-helix transcriptional regulator n=1 Tax=Nonomuraea sp. NPDC049400 TaxID=3364352 RepID=UPI0037A344EF